MIEISFKSTFDQLSKLLTDFERKQLPFAMARALTAVAKDAQQGAIAQARSAFDRPTPWTLNAFRTIPADKQSLTAVLLLKDRAGGAGVANEYLRLQEEGGTATPTASRFGGGGKGQALVRPAASARRNAYGNLPFRALKTLKAQRGTFVGRAGGKGAGRYGLWRRKGKGQGLDLLISFDRQRRYKPLFGYREKVQSVAAASMNRHLTQALQQALLTARPS